MRVKKLDPALTEDSKKAGATAPAFQQGYQDSNLELTESESVALPFGDIPLRTGNYTKRGQKSQSQFSDW